MTATAFGNVNSHATSGTQHSTAVLSVLQSVLSCCALVSLSLSGLRTSQILFISTLVMNFH